MPRITRSQLRQLAASFGHTDLVVEPRGTGYRARCSCGYISRIRRTETLAVEAAVHHFEVIARRALAAGITPAPAPSEGNRSA